MGAGHGGIVALSFSSMVGARSMLLIWAAFLPIKGPGSDNDRHTSQWILFELVVHIFCMKEPHLLTDANGTDVGFEGVYAFPD